MGIKITVFSGERIINGECHKSQTRGPDGRPDYGSEGTNAGHEWEARCGLEFDLDPAMLADPAVLHSTVTGYQKAATRLMREELARMGVPAHLIVTGNGHQVAAPASAPPAAIAAPLKAPTPAPAPPVPPVKKSPAPWGGGATQAPAPARRGKGRKEGQAPTTGGELLAWAKGLGTDDDPKFWFVAYAKAQQPKMSTMIKDWTEEQVLAAYNAYLQACEGA